MKKKLVAGILTAAMALSLAACGSSGTESTSSSASSATAEVSTSTSGASDTEAVTSGSTTTSSTTTKDIEPCTITFQYWADNTDYSALMQEIISDFNESNEYGITVEGEEIPWDGGGYTNTLFDEAVGGGAPDVATFKLSGTPMFVNNDLLVDLQPYVDAWEDKDDISENIYDIMKDAGGDEDSLYLMPWNVQVLYVYYRPSIFEEAGITETPTTYEEFLEDIKKCTIDRDGDGTTDVYGFGMRGGSGGQEPWGSFIYAEGGSFDDLTSEESIQGMQDFIDLYQNGYVPESATNDGYQETLANFESGLTAMFIHHIGSSQVLTEALGDDVAAFAFPAGEDQWTSLGDTETVMFQSCENKDAAFEWMKYLAAYEGEEKWCEGTGQVPVSTTVQQEDYFQSDEFMKVSFDSMDFAGTVPVTDTTTEWISEWPNIVGQALTGSITAEEAMTQLNDLLYNE
ncbi:MAG: sugar ABC transporter substrate-binding protein [Eubacteriales bacterium]|jgi:multiple sugar transport system substrate-binding protein